MNILKRFWFWLRSNFSRSAAFVSVVLFGYDVVRYSILAILITFFANDPNNYHIVKAAIFVYIRELVSASFGIPVAYMSDAGQFSHFQILHFSIIITVVGLLLFIFNLLYWGNEPVLYILGIVLLAMGEAGLCPLLEEVLVKQLRRHEPDANTVETPIEAPVENELDLLNDVLVEDQLRGNELDTNTMEAPVEDGVEVPVEDGVEDGVEVPVEAPEDEDREEHRVKARKRVWRVVAWVCSTFATFVISNYSWEIIFISSTSLFGGTYILFFFGNRFYHRTEFVGTGSSLFNFFHVLKASMLKWHLNYPTSPHHFYHNDGNQTHLSPQDKILRCLDKAAIIETSNLRPEEQERAGRLCTVTHVKESKLLLKMVPMWSTFIVIGMVNSTGDTFSSEQGKNMDSTDFTFYTVIFLKPITKAVVSCVFQKLLQPSERRPDTQHKQWKILRIWSGMVVCLIFCAVAWQVEVRRLKIVEHQTNKPDEEIQRMSIFWLAPQYFLLGLMEGSAVAGLDEFMFGELPNSLKNYASAMNTFVIDGFGSFISIFLVRLTRNLFNTTLDNSRLDKYYLILTIVSFVNMCYYWPISTIYYPISECT